MKAYYTHNLKRASYLDYIGAWGAGDVMPDDISLYIRGEDGDIWIDTECEGIPEPVFNGKWAQIRLPGYIYSKDECTEILKLVEPITNELLKSYNEEGSFEYHTLEIAKQKIEKIMMSFEPELEWDIEGILDQEGERE